MSSEKLSLQPIVPIKQIREASCVVASIAMIFRGLGVEVDEQSLIDKYFPTAKLPALTQDAGVTNTNTVKGMVQIRKDMGLENDLQIDIFEPDLFEYTRSRKNRYIVKVEPRALRSYGRRFPKGKEGGLRDFFETLEELVKKGEVDVYTANARMMGLEKRRRGGFFQDITDTARSNFYEELKEFVRKGHIVGPHGGMTMHARVLDGVSKVKLPSVSSRNPSDTSQEGFLIVDPRGESYPAAISHLVWVDSMGVRGDVFDYLIRVSPKTELLDPQQYGLWYFLQNLRQLFSL